MTLKFDMNLVVDSQLKANGLRFDANETASFSRELEYVHAEVIEAKYPEFKYRSVVPLKTGAPLGARSHRWFETDGYGSADFLDNMATEDFPTVEVKGAENTGVIKSMGAKYIVTVEDLRASQMMRVKIDTEKAKLVRRSIESKMDLAVWGGGYATLTGNFKGLNHNDSSTDYATSLANWFTEAGTAGDPLKIVANIRGMLEAAFLDTKGAFGKFDLFLPPELGVLLDRPMIVTSAIGSDTLKQATGQSIGQYALATVPYLRSITPDCFRLSASGGSGKHRVLAYPRDPEVLDAFIPLDFEQFAPQLSGMAFVTHCHAKYAGLRIKHIKAIRRMDLATS